MNSTENLAMFQSISLLTGEMAVCARAGEWDQLMVLEQRCAAMVTKLRAAQPVKLTADMHRQKIELIRKILADDAEIRAYTEPWMKNIQALLGNAGMARRVHKAYDSPACK